MTEAVSYRLSFMRIDEMISHHIDFGMEPFDREQVADYRDFLSIELIESDIVRDMFELHVRDKNIKERSTIVSELKSSFYHDHYESFVNYVILPVVVDIGTIDYASYVSKIPELANREHYFEQMVWRIKDDEIMFLFRLV